MSEALFLLCLSNSSQVARPPAHATAPRPPDVRAQLRLAVGQRDRLCWLGGRGKPESRQPQASQVHGVFPFVTVHKTMSTSLRRSSLRKWRSGTFLSLGRVLTVLTQEQADYIGVKIGVPFKCGHYRVWDARFSRGFHRLQRSRTSHRWSIWANSSRIELKCGTIPSMRARSRRTI